MMRKKSPEYAVIVVHEVSSAERFINAAKLHGGEGVIHKLMFVIPSPSPSPSPTPASPPPESRVLKSR